MATTIEVVGRDGEWVVRRRDDGAVLSCHRTRVDAEREACDLASRLRADVDLDAGPPEGGGAAGTEAEAVAWPAGRRPLRRRPGPAVA